MSRVSARQFFYRLVVTDTGHLFLLMIEGVLGIKTPKSECQPCVTGGPAQKLFWDTSSRS
jgi:hypothetical protein